MAAPLPFPPAEAEPNGGRVTRAAIFVRALRVEAEIGIHAAEYGRTQPLICDVEIAFNSQGFEHIADTINYESVVAHARAIAAEGHMKLVETFAERLGLALLDDPRAIRVRVRVEKPEALAPDAEAAGVELVLERP